LNKQRFFEKFKKNLRVVPVPIGDGETIHVREISSAELSKFQLAGVDKKGKPKPIDDFRERLVVLCACDETGEPIFADDDAETISQIPASVIEPIITAAQRLNRLGEQTDAEDVKKN
jgi:hypothetical protein